MIVDDSSTIRSVVRKILTHEKIELLEAVDGVQGLEMIRTHPPHIVILDVMMPNMSGLEVCFEVRSDPEIEATYILLLSQKADKDDQLLGLGTGADDYLPKPFSEAQLKKHVNKGLKQSKDWSELLVDQESGMGTGAGLIDGLRKLVTGFEDYEDEAHLLFMECDGFNELEEQGKGYFLTKMKESLKSLRGEKDLVFNMDEGLFALILMSRTLDEVILVSEKVQNQIENNSISIGIAGAETKEECEKLMERANEALEDAKSIGRGRVEIFHSF